jgi:CDP-6-deoxy-D-xylo-4-hexulose-3-dehydrase
MSAELIRKKILELVDEYDSLKNKAIFIPGETSIPPAGKVITANDLKYLVEASLDGWLTTGRFNEQFERNFSEYLDVKYTLTTTSGSSANLLALTSLTSPKLKDRKLNKGDEVITVAAGFPTTVNPIIQNGLIPVFVDVELPTYNINAELIEAAITEKTKAIMIAHTLGNAFDLAKVCELAKKYNLWLIEDCCDALGSTYNGKKLGTFGDIATFSFYPAHHITMGEGGALVTNSSRLRGVIESFRDWGRDCYCEPGQDNTCKKRFCQQLGQLPYGYDHKYTYSHVGYNLKITDMQAACGLGQLEKIVSFVQKRKDNFVYLSEKLTPYKNYFILPIAAKNSDPSWFGFPITLTEQCPFTRVELLTYLDKFNIGSRLLFAGNLIKQPYFKDIDYRAHGALPITEKIMHDTFWLGVYPALETPQFDFVVAKINDFITQYE